MKNKTLNPKEVVPAAQVAGADERSQQFWRDVESHLAMRARQRAQMVAPRLLTTPPKGNTVK